MGNTDLSSRPRNRPQSGKPHPVWKNSTQRCDRTRPCATGRGTRGCGKRGGSTSRHHGRSVVSNHGDIDASSRKIADIIGVIDSMAQTNILALNAAWWGAARAERTGAGIRRGGDGVRNLAQRSAGALKNQVADRPVPVDTVKGGTRLVQDARENHDRGRGKLPARLLSWWKEISHASRAERRDRAGDACSGSNGRRHQQNAALVEEAAAAAESRKKNRRGDSSRRSGCSDSLGPGATTGSRQG